MTPAKRRGPGRKAARIALLLLAAPFAFLPPMPAARARGDGNTSPLIFKLADTSGGRHRGPLLALREGWSIRLGGETDVRRDADGWLTLRRAGLPLPAPPAGPQLVLVGGARIPVKPDTLSLKGERLSFIHPMLNGGQPAAVPLSAVAVVWLAAPDGEGDAALVLRKLAAGKRRRDTVLLKNGDVVEGVLERVGRDGIRIDVARRGVEVEAAKVAAVAMSTELATPPRPKGPHGWLVLTDGTRLSLKSATCANGSTLKGTTAFGAALNVPLRRAAALEMRQASATYLSDLKPADYVYTPYLGVEWPLAEDGGVSGGGLRLGGSVYDKGLGMHSAARVTYKLPPGFSHFEALVGLDDRAGAKGNVRVAVLVDGKEADIGLKGDLQHTNSPIPIRVDVSGAKELTLAVDFGRGGDVGDHVAWADARLVK